MNEQQGQLLSFYCHARATHDGILISEWLLEQAKRMGLPGGSMFRAQAGFGRHKRLREEQFFELTDDLPVKVEFVLTHDDAIALIDAVRNAGVDTLYALAPASFGITGPGK